MILNVATVSELQGALAVRELRKMELLNQVEQLSEEMQAIRETIARKQGQPTRKEQHLNPLGNRIEMLKQKSKENICAF